MMKTLADAMKASLFAILAALSTGATADAVPWIMRMNMTGAQYQEFYDFDLPDGYRPISVDIQDTDSDQNFGAIWINDGNNHPWIAHHNMTSAQYQAKVEEYAGDGYRVISVDAAGNYPNELYSAAWVNDGTALSDWAAAHRRTEGEIVDLNIDMLQQGFRPICIAGNGSASSARFSMIWEKNPEGWTYNIVTGYDEADFQTVAEIRLRNGYRMTYMTAYGNNENRRLGAIYVRTDGDHWRRQHDSFARHGQSFGEFVATMNNQFGNGFHPVSAVSYAASDNPRFGQVWVEEVADPVFTITGAAQPSLFGFDLAMQEYMESRWIQRGALAVTKDKRLVYNRAFTYDHPDQWLTQPWNRFRVASVSKPITAVAVLKAEELGLFSRDDTLADIEGFDTDGWSQGFNLPDQITVDMLLKHQSGIDGGADPMLNDFDIADALGVGLPIDLNNIIEWADGRGPDFVPGTGFEYSNFGYALLGHLIEVTSLGMYENFVREQVLCPLGAQTMRQGETRREDAHPDEVNYLNPLREYAYDAMGGGGIVPAPYGQYNIGNMDAHGGWVATAEELARFVSDFTSETSSVLLTPDQIDYMFNENEQSDNWGVGWQISGSTRRHNGALPGTWAYIIRMDNGVTISVLFNADPRVLGTPISDDAGAIRTALGDVANSIGNDGVTFWPAHDLFLPVTCVSTPCTPDLDGDGSVGSSDLAILLAAWNPYGPTRGVPGGPGASADLDGDGLIGSADLAVLLASWGGCG